MSWNYARRLHFLDLLIQWSWTGIHTACADLVYDADIQIVADVNLARQARVRSQFLLYRKAIAFEFAHLARIAFENLNTAGSATRIAATAVKNIDSRVFDYEYEFLAFRCVDFDRTSSGYSMDLWHQ